MSQYFEIHPVSPQLRLIRQAAEIVRQGGVVCYPTDSTYAIGCQMAEKGALERIRQLRQLGADHNFTLLCRDLTDISNYAKVENTAFRQIKAHTPGPYTFILTATRQVPRMTQHPKRKTIGIRVPENAICQALIAELGEPMLSTTLLLPGDDLPMTDPEDIRERIGKQVDLIIDGGNSLLEPSTVVDMSAEAPVVTRRGLGDPAVFE
ncbi:L-threonylcarbamoyladenylate synthase [Alkalilimnicola sp. S0819]|uniref:L-threonylcarbamoyladenylate synthase n=1 Tax=Alkalilimnicola sp. S0819 TaxID=2613922 RepID=UPI0012620200|nr:L-threonylcarbamoyladenylate synthase [Alkalilimnicola sp. S0819]KAB7619629.1 threonylcarbamoyl-AMP synthase [Alkalilimnicola sp. S0819]MPQ17566.1 threonylcarbamoyl-AMP synthase [Alkalilimnicola sp. S0819]